MGPQRCSWSSPLKLWVLHGKRNSTSVLKSRLLRWDCPGLSRWAERNHGVFLRGRREGHSEQRCDQRSRGERFEDATQLALMMEAQATGKGCRQPLETGKGGKDILPRASGRMQPWRHLDFMTSGFQNCKLVDFILSHCICGTCYSSSRKLIKEYSSSQEKQWSTHLLKNYHFFFKLRCTWFTIYMFLVYNSDSQFLKVTLHL